MNEATGERFRFEIIPILLTVALAVGIAFLAFATIEFLKFVVHLPERPQMPWLTGTYYHLAELLYALGAIALLKRQRPGSYGLQWPEGDTYLGAAIVWGVVFGVVMAAVDYAPQLVSLRRPEQPYPLTGLNVVGWFAYAGVFLGIVEEVLFRGLLVTYLAQKLPGRIVFGRFALNGAGVVVAIIYASSYAESFLNKPLAVALGQLIYAFLFSLFLAYWYEKSKSLFASIVGHNVSGIVAQAIVFAMVAAFR